MGNGAGTHGAGFERDVQVAAVKPAGAALRQRPPDRQHLGVRSRIAEFAHAIALGGEHLPVLDDHRAYRRLVIGCRLLGKGEGEVHG